jgi:hypothetical protein
MYRLFPVLFVVACVPTLEEVVAEFPLSDFDDAEVGVASLSVDIATHDLVVGDSASWSATFVDADGSSSDVTDQVDWDIADDQVVSVTSGSITARDAGSTTLTLSYDGYVKSLELSVAALEEEEEEEEERPRDTGTPPAQLAGLTVDSVVAQSNDTELWYEIVVRNEGVVPSLPAEIDLFVDQPSAPIPGDIGSFIETLPSINPGETYTTALFTDSVAFDACTVACDSWVFVDSRLEVPEDDETNNVVGPISVTTLAPTVVTTLGPDLEVVGLTWTETASGFDYEVTVRNDGDEDVTSSFAVDLFPDAATAPAPDGVGAESAAIPELAVGDEATVSMSSTVDCSAGCNAYATVDAWQIVAESDDSNNLFGPVAVTNTPVTPPPPTVLGPDLEVDVTWLETGAGFDFTVTVTNTGDENAAKFVVDLYDDQDDAPERYDAGDDWKTVYNLDVGEAETFTLASLTDCTSECTAWVQVDTDDEVDESDETNNVHGPIAVMAAPPTEANLQVVDVTWSDNGSGIDYEITVRNDGDTDAVDFWVDVWADKTSVPVVNTNGDDYELVTNLAPHSETTVSLSVYNGCTLGCSSWVFLDSTGIVDESDESDNAAGPYDVLSTELPDLQITEIVAFPNNGELTYSITVENYGSADMAAESELHLFFDNWPTPSSTSTSGFVATIDPIDAGESAWVTFSTDNVDVLDDCTHGCFVTANADPSDVLPELDDSNNQLDIYVTPTP